MEEILANIERHMCTFQILDDDCKAGELPSGAALAFVSGIRINGKPIPPPVMTQQRRQEMRELRCAAIQREQELASRRRLRLLEKVQNIVNGIEERRSSSQARHVDGAPIPPEPQPDAPVNLAKNPETPDNLIRTPTETVHHILSMKQPDQDTRLSESLGPEHKVPHGSANPVGSLASAQGSTSSSSDSSLLNQTVVAASEFSREDREDSSRTPEDFHREEGPMQGEELSNLPSGKDREATATNKVSMREIRSSQIDASSFNPVDETGTTSLETHQDMTSRHLTNVLDGTASSSGTIAGVKLACSWSKEIDEVPKPAETLRGVDSAVKGLHLMPSLTDSSQDDEDDFEPFGERDSYLNLLGEYSSLPMPSGSSHFFSSVSEVPSSTPVDNPSPTLIKKSTDSSQKSPAEQSNKSPGDKTSPKVEDSSMFISSSSTLLTNTVGQSCTLPSSLRTISAASTLQDIDDPWNTLIETPLPTREDLEAHPDVNAPRGTPVGQEDSAGGNPTSATKASKASSDSSGSNPTPATKASKASPDSSSSEYEFTSPEKRVRKNSYTLDHPSPALLNAQARNEAPHAKLRQSEPAMRRTLELAKDSEDSEDSEANINAKEAKESQLNESGGQIDQNKEPTEESLHRQLQYFEEMRQQLERQQQEQLQQLLMEQQQAQIALQQEMAQMERHFLQQQQQQQRASSREAGRVDVPGVAGEKAQGDVDTVTTPSAVSTDSKTPLMTTRLSPPANVQPRDTSPSIVTKTSPTVKPTSTGGSGGQVEPFYLRGEQNQQAVKGASPSPHVTRSPGVGENAETPVMIRSPLNKVNSPTMKRKFDKVSAAAKGYLTRKVFKTHRVQTIIKTIKDSAAFADKFISETPIKQGGMSMQDMVLAERVLAQVRAAQYDLYDVFFTLSVAQRMDLIDQSRKLNKEGGLKKKVPVEQDKIPLRPLSAATIKALERKKKAKEAEERVFGDKKSILKEKAPSSRSRPMSAAEGRILKPLLSQKSPARPASTNTYRPSKYGIVINQEPPKAKDPKKLTHDPSRSKATSQRAPGNNTQGMRSTKVRSPVTVKTKGVRRSLYPIANPSKKAPRRTMDVRK